MLSFMHGKRGRSGRRDDPMSLHDWHLHTGFSSDSDEKMERVAETAIGQGMTCICITDHYDMGYPTGEFCLDTEAYLQKLRGVQ